MKEIAITEFENLKIGQAENVQAGTGCTVLLLGKEGAPAGLDVQGGGPASRESELLKPTAAAGVIHAILLSGGSAFGLDAAAVQFHDFFGNGKPKPRAAHGPASGFIHPVKPLKNTANVFFGNAHACVFDINFVKPFGFFQPNGDGGPFAAILNGIG